MDLPSHNRASDNVQLIPDGLQQLMSDITREVLRSQPTELYGFIAEYLEGVMKYRCLPRKFDSLGGYETFSSDTPSTIKSFETFTPSSSEVTGYETFSSSSPDTSIQTEESSRVCSEGESEGEEEMEAKSGSQMASERSVSITRSVSTKDTLNIKAQPPPSPQSVKDSESKLGSAEISPSKSENVASE